MFYSSGTTVQSLFFSGLNNRTLYRHTYQQIFVMVKLAVNETLMILIRLQIYFSKSLRSKYLFEPSVHIS